MDMFCINYTLTIQLLFFSLDFGVKCDPDMFLTGFREIHSITPPSHLNE